MIEQLNAIDKELLLAINGFNCAYADSAMWLLSGAGAYLLMALMFLYLSAKQGWKQALMILLMLALTITLADQVSSGLIKPLVCRLRPTHDAEIGGLIHLVNGYKGGPYGFVSSHAANAFGAAALIALLFRDLRVTSAVMLWAAAVSYSRMYLGVHYLGDIIGGAVVGALSAYVIYGFLKFLLQKRKVSVNYSRKDASLMSISILANIVVLLIVAIFFDV